MKEEDQFYKECDKKYCPANKRFIGSKSKNCTTDKEKRVECYRKYKEKYKAPRKPYMKKKKNIINKEIKEYKIVKKLDGHWKEAVLLEWNYQCAFGNHVAVWGHHYVRKNISKINRWNIKNGVPCCDKCHKIIHSNSLEITDQKVLNAIIEKWTYKAVLDFYNFNCKDFDGDYDKIEKELKSYLKKLRG